MNPWPGQARVRRESLHRLQAAIAHELMPATTWSQTQSAMPRGAVASEIALRTAWALVSWVRRRKLVVRSRKQPELQFPFFPGVGCHPLYRKGTTKNGKNAYNTIETLATKGLPQTGEAKNPHGGALSGFSEQPNKNQGKIKGAFASLLAIVVDTKGVIAKGSQTRKCHKSGFRGSDFGESC